MTSQVHVEAIIYFNETVFNDGVSIWSKQPVYERCGRNLGMSSKYQNKKKHPYQHMSGNI
jgi:hypothetical protein